MRERVHINIHIFLCVDSCNSHNWNKCQEFGFPLSGRWKRVLLCVKWGGWNMLWNVDLKASRDIPGDIRTFARKLVMGSVDLSLLQRGRTWGIIHVCWFCWILCVSSGGHVLHIPLLRGDVPDGTSSGTGTRGRENGHTQDTNEISITDWNLVQGNLGRNRLETWEDIGMHCLSLLTIGSFLTVSIVRGSTRRYRHDLSQVGRILGFGL